ncbi:uncharacterized protein LOC126850659 [Cataglyphis hispanica]|uniref:uncharacterized protein LOC126850659 n=1 Tax=Cataglyphis hispanica TaxID=1086592 RepID=UPI00218096B6|nr:uncharacterized protein LOC126850659 [Cataglyphis hispanica]
MFRTSQKFHKLKCGKQNDIPTRLEIEQCLGTSLAQILFNYSHREMIKVLDSTRSARVLQQSCYKAQNDQLKTDFIRASEKQNILKSNIHHDILTLGEEELMRFEAQIEALTQSKLRNEFAKERCMLEAEKRFAINCNADEIHAKYEEFFKSAQQELEQEIKTELANINNKHKKEMQKIAVKTRLDTTHDVLRKLRPQMYCIIKSLYDNLELSHRAQREKMIADFNKIMRKQHLKLDTRIREVEKKKIEELRIQHHELEIQNIMNIVFILCMERLRNSLQMHAIYKHCEEKIKFLHELIAKQNDAINTMKKRITEYHNKNVMLQEKVIAITKEFQKFINFAFDAMPEHADFLLPLDLLSVNSINKEDNKQEKS